MNPENAPVYPHPRDPESERRDRLRADLKAARSSIGDAFAVARDRDQAARLHQIWLSIARELEAV